MYGPAMVRSLNKTFDYGGIYNLPYVSAIVETFLKIS